MNPNNVYVINDGIDITTYSNHFCKSFEECVMVNISNWDGDLIENFYVHNSSNKTDKKKDFIYKLFQHAIDIIARKFDYNESDNHFKYLPQGTVHLKPHTLYFCAVALANGRYKNILNKCLDIESFSLQDLILAEIHNQNQIRDLHESAMRHKPNNSSHIVYTFFIKHTENNTVNLFKLRIIEALSLSSKEEDREDTTNKIFEDTITLFSTLNIPYDDVGSLILIDETSVLKNSAHIFQFLKHICKHPLYVNISADGCNALATKSCNVSEQPILEAHPHAYNELKIENMRLNELVKEYKKKYCNLLHYTKRSKENISKKTSREILDKLSDSHNELIRSQQERYEQIISITKQNHDDKFKTLTDYYNERLKNQDTKLKSYDNVNEECKTLKNENDMLKASIFSYKEKLENIQNLIQDRPQTISKVSTIAPPKQECLTVRNQTKRNSAQSKVSDLEKKMDDMEAKKEQLLQQLQSKDNTIENYLQQIKYLKDVIADSEKAKKLMEQENFELSKTIENIQSRHNDQFKEYDKLLKKRRQENELHKREIMRLREHFHSENYPSPALIRKRRQLNISSASPKSSPLLKAGKQISLSQPENTTPLTLPIEKESSEPSLSQGSVPMDALSEISPSAVEREGSSSYNFSDAEDSIKLAKLSAKDKTPQSSQSSITVVTLSSTSSDAARFATPMKKSNQKVITESQSTITMPSSSSSIQVSPLSQPSLGSASTIKTYRCDLLVSNGKRCETASDSTRSTPVPSKKPRGRPRKPRL